MLDAHDVSRTPLVITDQHHGCSNPGKHHELGHIALVWLRPSDLIHSPEVQAPTTITFFPT